MSTTDTIASTVLEHYPDLQGIYLFGSFGTVQRQSHEHKKRIFISSVQKELERAAVAGLISTAPF